MAFKVQGDSRGKSKYIDNSDLFCTNCNIKGHDNKGCFQLIGYPEWWGDRPRMPVKGGGRGSSTSRGSRQDYRRGDAGRGKSTGSSTNNSDSSNVRANKVDSNSLHIANNKQQGQQGLTADVSSLVGVSTSQIQQILEILNSNKDNTHGCEDEDGDWPR
ncbi:uncharacterized protein [Spinacia oleracea]|uniref:Uncharacterized protein n=1 Tax=Spinacia oleracea TaxID=3562 RepID=A0ABM3R7G7_SPIOL|nr:uncharacterized protein LOC130467111 [Spinacia oleracea]